MRRSTSCLLLLAASLTAFAGCDPSADDRQELLPVFGADGVLDVVEQAEDVTAERIADNGTEQKASEFERIGEPVEVPREVAERLKRLFLDPSSYWFEGAKGCVPTYGVRMSFRQGNDVVAVLICFDCDILDVQFNDGRVGGEDFDPIAEELDGIMKRLFPHDEAIQAL